MNMACSAPRKSLLLVSPHGPPGRFEELRRLLSEAGYEVASADESFLSASEADGPEGLEGSGDLEAPAAVIIGVGPEAFGRASSLLDHAGRRFPHLPVLVAADRLDSAQIQALLEASASDFLVSPYASEDLLPRLWRALTCQAVRGRRTGEVPSCEPAGLARFGLLGGSAPFLAEVAKLKSVARCDVTVLLSGETGTGKELFARAIHYLSPRHTEPFVPVDCGALPVELAESELFGHERGAFTSATSRAPGLIAAAGRGTMFLDEVEALPLSVQTKLLRFLQQREYRAVGSCETRRTEARVISATNSDLQDRVRRSEFREDLYYRLKVVQLNLPPLRDRAEDIALLARHFMTKHADRLAVPVPELSRDAESRLLLHSWPGNIRELEHVLEAAVALCDGSPIRACDLSLPLSDVSLPFSFREAKARAVEEFEREFILRALRAHNGNITDAARSARKNRRAFWELMRKRGISSLGHRGLRGPAPSSLASKRARLSGPG
jgi:two-component system, NtrC family, response regulator GlrR